MNGTLFKAFPFRDELARLFPEEWGATSIEYTMVASLISAVIIFTLTSLGEGLNTMFFDISDVLPVIVAAAPR